MQRKEIEKYYIETINQLKKYNKEYFDHDKPIVSDEDYDKLKKKILSFEIKYKFLKKLKLPIDKVGYKPSNKFKKIKHLKPMLSLSNAFDKEDMKDFLSKISNFLNKKDMDIELSSEPKIDGISASLIYENGLFVKGLSRGDGITGEDIFKNLIRIIKL